MTVRTRPAGAPDRSLHTGSLLSASPVTPVPSGNADPRVMREIRLQDCLLRYELRRSDRRTIGFVIDAGGLRVIAPRPASIARIESALVDKRAWILRKLAEWDARRQRLERQAIRWEDGGTIPLLGHTLELRLDAGARGITRHDGQLVIGLPAHTAAEQLQSRVQRWLQAQAREVFTERLDWFSRQHGLAPRRWALSSARMRWGSCSADGSIRLNWRLVHFPPWIIDYVIAHELVHLREFNHSRRFWEMVAALCPDYRQARAWLRDGPADTVR